VVERRTVNPLVGGSNPSRGANKFLASKPIFGLGVIPDENRNADIKQARSATPKG
jgi:hypothetical protein